MDSLMVSKYFSEYGKAWLESSYEGDGHAFPTALARFRRTLGILQERFPGGTAEIVDLGCGAGQLCLSLAGAGHSVTGVDESEAMLAEARQTLATTAEAVGSRVQFLRRDLLDNGLWSRSWDAVTSLGVIGYLPNDEVLFAEAGRLLRPGGCFVVSCRNRLFNMVSVGDHTLRETESGGAKGLIQEIQGLIQQIPESDALSFVTSLAGVSSALASEGPPDAQARKQAPEQPVNPVEEPRQHTPSGLLKTALAHGFTLEGYYGVHPHLLMAGLNWSLPPHVYNTLSSSLEVLGHLPVSLIWSSLFIGVFRKVA